MRFLLIEDNVRLADSVRQRLQLDGHVADHALGIKEADGYLAGAEYDLILLDLTLPDGDGRGFLKAHRRANHDTPVIVLTARSSVSDRIDVLDIGADDYLIKPFDFAELEARCRAVLRRRHGSASANLVRYADIEFDPLSATVKVNNDLHRLRNRELRLLEILLNEPKRLFSKTQLSDRLFSYAEDTSDNAIEVYVGRLRKKLQGSRARIETVRGIGYRITKS